MTIVMFAALGYGFGKTLQVYRDFTANPQLYTSPNPSWIQTLIPSWSIVAAAIIAGLLVRWIIRTRASRG